MSAGPWYYASELCGEAYPTPERIFDALGLGRVRVDDLTGGRTVVSARGRRVLGNDFYAPWCPAVVLAAVIHPNPSAELLAAATTLIVDGRVEELP